MLAAIKAGDEPAVEALLKEHPALADGRKDGVSLLLVALYHGKKGVAEIFASRGTALDIFEAAALGRVARLEQLLDLSPSLVHEFSPDGYHPLGLAAFFAGPRAVKLLLERGARVDAAARNAMKVAAIHSAVHNLESVRLLVEAGADLNARQMAGYTALMAAAGHGDAPVVELLVARGADPALRSDAGETAADLAAKNGHVALAARLRG